MKRACLCNEMTSKFENLAEPMPRVQDSEAARKQLICRHMRDAGGPENADVRRSQKPSLEVILVYLLLFFISSAVAETPLDSFLNTYPGPIYQDIVIGDDIYPIGTDICESRYELIRPILDRFNGSFSLLDLGAAQGYFSFRIAHDYPQSACVMIESNNTSYYARHGDMLYDLCLFNCHLENVTYLSKRIHLADLSFLNQREHFDFIFAFLVLHQVEETLQEQVMILESLLALGDNLIVETANDVDVIFTSYVEFLSQSLDCQYLGEVKRHKNPQSDSTGKLFWFKRKTLQSGNTTRNGIQPETFEYLNGVYPIY